MAQARPVKMSGVARVRVSVIASLEPKAPLSIANQLGPTGAPAWAISTEPAAAISPSTSAILSSTRRAVVDVRLSSRMGFLLLAEHQHADVAHVIVLGCNRCAESAVLNHHDAVGQLQRFV